MKRNNLFMVLSIALLFVTHKSCSQSFFSSFLWWPGTKEDSITHEQDVDPGTEISLHALRGSVEIKTWNKHKVLVEATKVGTADELKLNKIDATYSKKYTSLKTNQLKPDRPCVINYTLVIPKDAILKDIAIEKGDFIAQDITTPAKIRVGYGNITLQNVSGSLDAAVKYGNIHIQSKDVTPMSKMVAIADKGSIKLEVPANTNALLCAKTKKGSITSECPITLEPRTMTVSQATLSSFKRDIRGSLGKGGTANINLHTGKGNVRVIEYS